jgi:hypothetical protein
MEKFDLATLDTVKSGDEGRELDVLHPATREPIGLKVRMHGADSTVYQKANRAQQRSIADRAARNRKLRLSAEEQDDLLLDLLVAATAGWSGTASLDGAELPAFTAAGARSLYLRFPWIREQADAFMADRANFLPRSATS